MSRSRVRNSSGRVEMPDTRSMARTKEGVRSRVGALERTENSEYAQLLRLLADIVSTPLRGPKDGDDLQKPQLSA